MKAAKQVILFLFLFSSCTEQEAPSLFTALSAKETNINFNNKITDTPEFNILDYLYFYNGGGVAAGDLNNDGLPDLFFTSNLGSDELYINEGDFKFKAVTHFFEEKELEGWSTGVTLVDINQDGWLDIYVCKLGNYAHFKDHNKLFINQEGESFVESAKEYGLDFSGFGTQAAFFDYDRDGDLDCYLLNHSVKNPSQFRPSKIRQQKDSLAGDLLLENRAGLFVDVTEAAGIYSSTVGFGLGIDVADLNGDGWLDIYVGNDFHENDYLYINQKDKTFKEVISTSTGHTSNFSMGCTSADINNDLRVDLLSLDMKPFDETVYKKSGGWEDLEIYNFKRSFKYHHQSARNALQINIGQHKGIPIFSEQAAYYGIEATDWSWSPLIFDFDNDGDKDIFISNGIVRRPNDMDFINFHFDANDPDKLNQIQKMPKGNVPNCYFENELETNSFSKKAYFNKSISTGAAVADLDRDGRLDIIVNNINEPATILKNNSKRPEAHFIQIKLEGDAANSFGLGASLILYAGNKTQLSQVKSSSGFQSFNEPIAHFGLSEDQVDSIKIIWPDGSIQVETISQLDKRYSFKKKKTRKRISSITTPLRNAKSIANYKHQENDFNDQQSNKWLLYNQSSFGPRLTELNEHTIYVTGNKNTDAGLINTRNNQFTPLNNGPINKDENSACLVTDRKQKNPQLYIAKGGNETKSADQSNADLLFKIENDLSFTPVKNQFPISAYNNAVCQASDYDHDGDMDIFVGVNSTPGQYGKADSSYLLINNNNSFSKKSLPIDGMVYDAKWFDLDGNGHEDLIIVGHWMPITVLYNDGEKFSKKELPESSGLWFSLYVADINEDGSPDLIAGNFGTNHSLKASIKEPIQFYQNDFDKNGYIETLVTYYKNGKEVPYPNQPLFAAQIPAIKKRYLKSEDYAAAKITDLIKTNSIKQSIRGEVVELNSVCFFQQKNNKWKKEILPATLQQSPIFSIEKGKDNRFFFGGNFFEVDPNWGRQDAGQLSLLEYRNSEWIDISKVAALPIIKGAIRDLLFKNEKLYIAINNEELQVVDFTEY